MAEDFPESQLKMYARVHLSELSTTRRLSRGRPRQHGGFLKWFLAVLSGGRALLVWMGSMCSRSALKRVVFPYRFGMHTVKSLEGTDKGRGDMTSRWMTDEIISFMRMDFALSTLSCNVLIEAPFHLLVVFFFRSSASVFLDYSGGVSHNGMCLLLPTYRMGNGAGAQGWKNVALQLSQTKGRSMLLFILKICLHFPPHGRCSRHWCARNVLH